MILVIMQMFIFFIWHIMSVIILVFRIKKPYQIFRKTHVWGKIEKFNFIAYTSFVFASLGLLVTIIHQIFTNSWFNYNFNIVITFFAILVYCFSVGFYTLEIIVFFKVKQNPLWLYKEEKMK